MVLGRTNTPAFSLRWFTSNQLHGDTRNPRNAALTPGGSSGGAAAAVAAGIGHIAHGTDIAGSIRYPAYACGVHGLRPTLGRVAAFNAALPERSLGGQITAVSGPLARSIADLRLGLAAMAAPDPRDPWWAPAPLEGPAAPKRVALCFYPDGLETEPAVVKALQDAARRLGEAGWRVDTLDAIPPLKEAADLQIRMWLADGYDAMVEAARKEGDRGAQVALAGQRERAAGMDLPDTPRCSRGAPRQWELFFAEYPVLLLPVSAELPFPDQLDLAGDERARLARADAADRRAVHGLASPVRGHGQRAGREGTIPVACSSWRAVTARTCAWPRARRSRRRTADRHRRTRSLRSASKPDADAAACLGFDPAGILRRISTAGGRARLNPSGMTRHAGRRRPATRRSSPMMPVSHRCSPTRVDARRTPSSLNPSAS